MGNSTNSFVLKNEISGILYYDSYINRPVCYLYGNDESRESKDIYVISRRKIESNKFGKYK